MLPLVPIALAVLPEIAKHLFGAGAAAMASDVARAVAVTTGTSDPAQARVAIQDPVVAAQLAIQLAQIAQTREAAIRTQEQADLAASLADMQAARAQTETLVAAKSPLAWGAPVLSFVVLLSFGGMITVVLSRAIPPGSEALANVLLGTLAGMATTVVSFWCGSSSSSRVKDDTLAAATASLANSVPLAPSQGSPK